MPDRLRLKLGPVSPLAASSTFRDLDLREAAMAPSLAAAPVRQALLVASFNLFSPDPAAASVGTTNLFVLTTVGNWRRVPLGDYGDFHAEPSFVLSPNGRELAVGEGNTRRVVVIDLTTGSAQGYSVPRQQPVGLRWSADGNELLFFARASAVGYRLDTRTGYVERTSYNVYNAGFDNKNDAVIEISVDDKGNGVLNRYRGNTIEKSQPLEYSRLLGRAPIQEKYVAFDHSPDRSTRATGDQPAIVVVDPQDGRLVSAIVDPRVRTDWVQTLAWVGEDHLAFARGRSGSVQVWNVTTGQLSELLTFANRGVHISLSSQVTQNLLEEGSALQ